MLYNWWRPTWSWYGFPERTKALISWLVWAKCTFSSIIPWIISNRFSLFKNKIIGKPEMIWLFNDLLIWELVNVAQHGSVFIADLIGLRLTQISLSVTCIVQIPRSDWRSSNGNLEDMGILSQSKETKISTVWPAVNCDAAEIDAAHRLRYPLQHFNLIVKLNCAL